MFDFGNKYVNSAVVAAELLLLFSITWSHYSLNLTAIANFLQQLLTFVVYAELVAVNVFAALYFMYNKNHPIVLMLSRLAEKFGYTPEWKELAGNPLFRTVNYSLNEYKKKDATGDDGGVC